MSSESSSTLLPLEDAPPVLTDAVKLFLSYCKIECGFSPLTQQAYEMDLRDLLAWMLDQRLSNWHELNYPRMTEHIRWLDTDRGLSVASIARHIATLRVFTRFLHASELVKQNAGELLAQPAKWKNLPGVMSQEQIDALLHAPDPANPLYLRDRAILETLYACGMRASEIATLSVSSLISDVGVIRIFGKGNKERIVPIGVPAMNAVLTYLEDLRPKLLVNKPQTDAMFLSRTGRPLDRLIIWQIVKRHAKAAGLSNIHPHKLRHSFATHMLAGGADLRVVQELLGHSNIVTTQIYTHVDRSHLQKVIQKHHPRA